MKSGRRKILLVEDSEFCLELIRKAFEGRSHDMGLMVLGSLRDANAHIRESTPDIVIAGLKLSDGRGTELLPVAEEPRFPLVFLVEPGEEELGEEAVEHGALDYVTKDERELLGIVRVVERALREWGHVLARREAEESLRASEEKFKNIFDTASEAIFIHNFEGRFLEVNRVACESLGYSRREFLNMTPADVEAPEFGAVISDRMEELRRSGRSVYETLHQRKDGSTFPAEVSTRVIQYQGKDAVLSFARDITIRKGAEEALRESEERYRTVLEANPDPVVVYDMEGKVIYFNPAFTRYFGWTLEERQGKKMDLFVPEENWPETEIMIDRVLKGQGFSGVESRRFTRDGRILEVSISAAVYRDSRGEPKGSVINLRDITEQKSLVAQYQHAQKMEAIGTLAGGIAHDFNNLLQGIQGYTELLLLDIEEGAPGHDELMEILKAGRRGRDLVQQLLTFSRKVESQLRPIDLNREIREMARLLQRTLPKMVEIELRLGDDLKHIEADPGQMEQVLLNLALNANDAMPRGGRLTISTENTFLDARFCRKHPGAAPGHHVLLTISDTGQGMEKDMVDNIFDPFYSTKEVGKGTGLGLSMVYGIIKSHGGHIACESELDRGTTFKIYLPAVDPTREDAGAGAALGFLGGSETILLVDDEDFIRSLGASTLTRFGYNVIPAESGEKAVEIYRERMDEVDLVILDLIMPGLGGVRCLEGIMEINPWAKVLIASGYSVEGKPDEALETGARAFIKKPYDIEEMLEMVRRVLDAD